LLNQEIQTIVKKSQQLRLSGNFQAAIENLNQIVRHNLQEPIVLMEALKLLLLVNDANQIQALLNALRVLPKNSYVWEAELLWRISSLTSVDVSAELKQESLSYHSAWAKACQKGEADVKVDFCISAMTLAVASGVTVFDFSGTCPDCGLDMKLPLPMTFAVEREIICPQCFLQLRLDGALIVAYIKEQRKDLLSDKFVDYDKTMMALQDKVGEYHDENIPYLVRAHNQSFISYLSELLYNRLSLPS